MMTLTANDFMKLSDVAQTLMNVWAEWQGFDLKEVYEIEGPTRDELQPGTDHTDGGQVRSYLRNEKGDRYVAEGTRDPASLTTTRALRAFPTRVVQELNRMRG